MRRLILAALFLSFYSAARADVDQVYDWSFTGTTYCGLGPGCAGFRAQSVFESGTFTVQGTDVTVPNIVSYTGFSSDGVSTFDDLFLYQEINVIANWGPGCGGECTGPAQAAGFFSYTPAVPEPSTWAMMILGFSGLGFMAYRRKQNGSAFSIA
jgi:hypothetical protein